ncbi:MAG: PEP-CTERM sorting domain-containing protein [Terriglobales bacterium]
MKLETTKEVLVVFAVAIAAALLPARARAGALTWQLNGVTFADGGTATGSFSYDAASNSMTAWSISTSGGDTADFPAFTFNPSNSFFLFEGYPTAAPWSYVFSTDQVYSAYSDENLFFSINPAAQLTDAGGDISILTNNDPFSIEFYDCYPSRFMTAGTVSALATPEPATWLLLASGLLGLGVHERKRWLGRRTTTGPANA